MFTSLLLPLFMASVVSIQAQLNNRADTQKLYTVLSQFNQFNNPLKHYARKMKVKRIIPSSSSNPIEYIIIPSHLAHMPITGGTGGTGGSGGSDIKPRKKMKMKITENSNDIEPETAKPAEEDTNIVILKPNEYEKIKNTKYGVTELRALCRYYGVKISGTKNEITTRLYNHLIQSYFIVKIQRIVRQFISSKYRKICGPGYLHTKDCVNDVDFYTFDRLADINPTELFTYRDTDDKIYGFHIASIYHLIISSYPTILNPYNRKVIPASIINNLYEKLIYGSLLGFRVSIKLDDANNDENTSAVVVAPSSGISRERQEELFVVDLFQHINTLGNYSDSEWFNTLQRDELIRFYS